MSGYPTNRDLTLYASDSVPIRNHDPLSADEVCFQQSATEEIMEIRASRRKSEWDPPRVVRFHENYYRLEACFKCAGPRPFRYTLRKLSAGVPGRKVIVYEPGDAVVAGKR